jgi:hypothetical protein
VFGVTTLQDYITQTQNLMRDANAQFTTVTQLTRYINQARRRTAMKSACLEALVTGQSAFGTSAQPGNMIPGAFIPGALPNSASGNSNEPGAQATASNSFTTIPGVELYSYNYANPYLQQQYTGYDKVIYVFNISVAISGYMPTLRWMPFDMMQAWMRSINTGVTSYPAVWSAKGVGENGQAYLFPMPTNISFGTMEWQCICTPKPLYTNADYEALPEAYHSAIKYYAARMAYLGQQRTGMAEIMTGLWEEELLMNSVATDWGHVEDYYAQLGF